MNEGQLNPIQLMRKINELEDNINALKTIQTGGIWTAYTPTWTASTTNPDIGNGTIAGRYTVIGKVCHVLVYVLAGSTTTAGSGSYSFTYPINPKSLNYVGGTWLELETGANIYTGVIYGYSSTFALGVNGASFVTNLSPFTFADTDFIRAYLTYEIA